ncbi:MAG: Mth938-like domain-containing protein [Rickettsiales bacterium]|nr:Mth938-like domain-containing protein [Rickettsiales bacterium]
MDITPLIKKGRNIIDSYSDLGFKISKKDFSGSIILLPTKVTEIKLNENEIFEEEKLLNLIAEFSEEKIEILLIGTGKTHKAPNHNFKQRIREKLPSASVDFMTTAAACRTFNILTLEDRIVAAILVI